LAAEPLFQGHFFRPEVLLLVRIGRGKAYNSLNLGFFTITLRLIGKARTP
jgi:hypothetical protein